MSNSNGIQSRSPLFHIVSVYTGAMTIILAGVAFVLFLIEVIRSRGESLMAWGGLALAAGLFLPAFMRGL